MQVETRARTSALILALLTLTSCADKSGLPRVIAGADAARGRQVVAQLACAACHDIPGVAWPVGRMGGSLAGFADRPLIAGRFPNQPDVLVRWLTDAPALDPSTGMPPMPMTTAQARDVAAYLYALQ